MKIPMVIIVAFLGIFWEASFDLIRRFLGAQPHILPALMVYTSLRGGTLGVCLLAFLGGLLFDSLSSNPLGVSILPLLATGMALQIRSGLILQTQPFAQGVLGAAASVVVPGMTLLLLLTLGEQPLIGWGTLWQFIVMAAAGACATPVFFVLFEWLQRTFLYAGAPETSFRSDREIRRGR